MGHSLITNHFFQSMLFNLAMLDSAHPFRWRGRPLMGWANKALQPGGLTGVICQAPPACLQWSHRWIYPKVNGDSPGRPWAPRSDYRPSFQVALIDVACVYLFTMPLNLWIQCNVGRRGTTMGAERKREQGPAWFDLCYAMQSNRETAQMKGLGWNSLVGRRLWFCIGVERALGWILCISHTGSCRHAIRITNMQQKE